MNLENFYLIELPEIEDGIDGTISVAEGSHHIPFEIKRVYYIYGLENANAIRGKHAHKHLEQVIFCIHGSFLLGVDDGIHRKEMLMNRRNQGVYLGTGLWHTMTQFSKECVLLVLASDYYDESDYIRDYSEFKRYILNKTA
jgi:dTDP-4-dehydrorhamnose 3,5-epimerase-like enzyme